MRQLTDPAALEQRMRAGRWSARALAGQVGASHTVVADLVAGRQSRTRDAVAAGIEHVLDVAPGDLFTLPKGLTAEGPDGTAPDP